MKTSKFKLRRLWSGQAEYTGRTKLVNVLVQSALAIGTVGSLLLIGSLIYRLTPTPDLTGKAGLGVIEQRVGKHFLLPTNEVPALATITDTKKISAIFFKHAKNGDKVLIYKKNKLAIIYRPSIDKIIEVGPVTLGNSGT